ncbi:MAG: nitroreductase family protein [Anaerolineae bacterium]
MIINETLSIIKQRRSVRRYKKEQIGEEELHAILEAGLYAPYGWTEEGKHFTVVQDADLLTRLNAAAKQVASGLDFGVFQELGTKPGYNCLWDAPTLIIVSGDEKSPDAAADCAAAMQNMLIAAESVGVGSCWIFFVMLAFGSAQGAELLQELQIPTGYKPMYAAVFGYRKGAMGKASERKPGTITHIR